MRAANFHVDQMLCVYQAIIVQHVFVAMVLRAIQMISIWDVNRSVKELKYPILAIVMRIVDPAKFVLSEQMDLKIALIHAIRLLAV